MRDDAVDVALKVAGSIVRPLVYTTLSLPAVIVVASSFTAGDDLRFPPEGFSPRWYMAAFKSDMFMGSLWTSTKLAFVTMVLSLTLGMAAAFAIDRRSFPGKHAFRTLTLSRGRPGMTDLEPLFPSSVEMDRRCRAAKELRADYLRGLTRGVRRKLFPQKRSVVESLSEFSPCETGRSPG